MGGSGLLGGEAGSKLNLNNSVRDGVPGRGGEPLERPVAAGAAE